MPTVKRCHRPDLFCWSVFDEARDIDFNSYAWARPEGTIVVDPLPLGAHDLAHLKGLGPVAWIVVTNSDHLRATAALAELTGASVAGPAGEQGTLGIDAARWLADGEELVEGLRCLAFDGSKTPGELALVLEQTTLITGDLVRAHRGGGLDLLPAPKLSDPAVARASAGFPSAR